MKPNDCTFNRTQCDYIFECGSASINNIDESESQRREDRKVLDIAPHNSQMQA